jgi:AcrR family transcriptional regulator
VALIDVLLRDEPLCSARAYDLLTRYAIKSLSDRKCAASYDAKGDQKGDALSEERPATTGGRRTGRPPLTERRKAATRLEIAREAVRLFTDQGVAATSAEEIAEAAGVSVRTLWRYFPTKESCVRPLLTEGAELLVRSLRDWTVDGTPPESEADIPTVLALIRLTWTEPSLRAVWLQAHDAAQPLFAELIAERSGVPADDLTVVVQAAMLNGALRAGVEHAARQGGEETLAETLDTALRIVSQVLPE